MAGAVGLDWVWPRGGLGGFPTVTDVAGLWKSQEIIWWGIWCNVHVHRPFLNRAGLQMPMRGHSISIELFGSKNRKITFILFMKFRLISTSKASTQMNNHIHPWQLYYSLWSLSSIAAVDTVCTVSKNQQVKSKVLGHPIAKLPENTQPSCRNVFPMGVSEPRVEVSTGPAVISTGISSLTPEIYKAINKLFSNVWFCFTNLEEVIFIFVFKGTLFWRENNGFFK